MGQLMAETVEQTLKVGGGGVASWLWIIFVILGVLGAAGLGFLIFFLLKRRKKEEEKPRKAEKKRKEEKPARKAEEPVRKPEPYRPPEPVRPATSAGRGADCSAVASGLGFLAEGQDGLDGPGPGHGQAG